MSAVSIGDLNRRLVLQEPVENADDEGGVTRSYQTVTTLWAQVRPLGAGTDVAAGSLGAALRTASSCARATTSPRAIGLSTARTSIA